MFANTDNVTFETQFRCRIKTEQGRWRFQQLKFVNVNDNSYGHYIVYRPPGDKVWKICVRTTETDSGVKYSTLTPVETKAEFRAMVRDWMDSLSG